MNELKLFLKYYIEKDLENSNAKLKKIDFNFDLEEEETLKKLENDLKNKGIKIYEINSNNKTLGNILERYSIEYYYELENFISLIYKWIDKLELLELLKSDGVVVECYNPNETFYTTVEDYREFYKEHFKEKYSKEKNKEILKDIEYLIDNLSEDIIKKKLEIDLGYLCLHNEEGERFIIKL